MSAARIRAVIIDVPRKDFEAALQFWSAALGHQQQHKEGSDYYWFPEPSPGMSLALQRIGEGPARIHVDVSSGDVEREAARLEGLGAERVVAVQDWWQMRDPSGLLFCVIPEYEGESP